MTKRGVNGWGNTHLKALYQSHRDGFSLPYILGYAFRLPLTALEAMAFKELLILIAIAIEDIDIDIAMDATHLTIRTQLPVS